MSIRVTQIKVLDGVEVTIAALILSSSIHWQRQVQMQAWQQDQSFEDFLKSGPPDLVSGLTEEKRQEIERRVRGTPGRT